MTRILMAVLTALMILPAAVTARAAPLDPALAFALTVTPDAQGDLAVAWDVQPGYYLYRSQIRAEGEAGPIPLTLPAGEVYDDPWMGEDQIYRTALAIVIPAPQGPVTLHWQGCQQDGICYAPQQVMLGADGRVIAEPARDSAFPGWSALSGGNADTLQSSPVGAAPATDASAGLTLAQDQGIVAELAGRGGAVLVIAGFFGFGLLLSLTPCVLPMVPIVAGMLTRQGTGLTARRGLALNGAYVVAMAGAFGLLGVVAAWSGANLQAALQSPIAIGVIAGIFVVLALSMFGLFQMQMPAAWQARIAARQGGGARSLGGAAALGFGSALIVGPCVTAPLAGALIYIAQTGDVMLGAGALFALGLGQGVPLLAVGAFGPAILPRRGAWMERVRLAFGVVFLGFALWLAGRILPGPVVLALWAALLIGCGVAIGALNRLSPDAGRGARMAAAAGVLLVFAGLVQGLGAALGGDDPTRPLAPLVARAPSGDPSFQTVTTQAGLAQALQAPGPALIYVTADWCVICRAIERGPMADRQVMAAMQDMVRIKVDVTDFGTEAQAIMADLAAAGPPTLIFVDAARSEPQESRLIGDMSAGRLLASVRQVAP
ncbi:MAG: protein-disulfide reductase DsbD [Paracoccus hibiscisoli]|uniref:protein-disulfide reductase DsbD n=1 Tax=Paracoccus hibiscisoli TaxID=2023261 RepID=UPI003918CB65